MAQRYVCIATIFAAAQLTPPGAHACITRMLSPPDAIGEYLKNKPAQADGALPLLAEAFQRDKTYHDALVLDFCGIIMRGDNKADERRKLIDSQIMNLLISKWAPNPIGESRSP